MDLDELYRFLRSAHVQAQGVLDTIRDPLLVLDADLTVISANPAFLRTFETCRDDTIGISLHDLGNGQWNIDELRRLLEDVIPKSASVFDYEVTAVFPVVGHRTMLLSAQRIMQPGSGRRVLLLSIVDATERRKKDDKKDILIGELHHRIKNLMAVTRSLARQTNVKDRTAEEYRDAFLGRFDALAGILEVTAKDHMAELPTLARKVLEPYTGRSKAIVLEDGPTVSLSTSQAMALGMILHELATNALKYGALSVPDGLITIIWSIEVDEEDVAQVHFRWQESNGPRVSPPTADGFGTKLIKFTAGQDLGGRVELNYASDGLIVTIIFPR